MASTTGDSSCLGAARGFGGAGNLLPTDRTNSLAESCFSSGAARDMKFSAAWFWRNCWRRVGLKPNLRRIMNPYSSTSTLVAGMADGDYI